MTQKELLYLLSLLTLLFAVKFEAQQASSTLEGVLNVVWGDPRPGSVIGGRMRYSLTLADGSQVELQPTGQRDLTSYFRKRVEVTGRTVSNQATRAAESATLLVDSVVQRPDLVVAPPPPAA